MPPKREGGVDDAARDIKDESLLMSSGITGEKLQSGKTCINICTLSMSHLYKDVCHIGLKQPSDDNQNPKFFNTRPSSE